MPKIGLALSGGGARCISQLGVLHFFEEKGIVISEFSGASGGAIIGALISSGMRALEAYSALKDINYKSHLKLNITNGSLYHLDRAIEDFHKVFGKKDIKDFPTPFYATVVNYESGKVEYRDSGDMVTLMLASSALIPYFAPVEYEGKVYVDGGICENLPTEPLTKSCDKIIAINVNPFFTSYKNSFKSHASRAMFLMLNHSVNQRKKEADIFIEIEEMGRYSIFDLKHFELFFEFGYNQAKKLEREIDESIYT
jgi:NTE family protein